MMNYLQIIYVMREPRDVVYSMYHFARLHIIYGYKGSLDAFIDQVIHDQSM